MKQFIILSLSALLTVSLTSCGAMKESIHVVDSPIDSGRAVKVLISADGSDSSLCTVDYSYFKVTGMPYRDSINLRIKNYITRITQFGGKRESKLKLSSDFVNAQLDSFELVYKGEVEAEIYHLWSLEGTIEIDDVRDDFAQLQLSAWSYTGGAHGNGATTTYIIDKLTGNQILFNDFFSDPKAVTSIAEEYFRKSLEIEKEVSLDEAGFWFENNQFHLNNNFSIVRDKIVFLFNSYEIAPYSAGETVIEIPLEEIRSFIKVKI